MGVFITDVFVARFLQVDGGAPIADGGRLFVDDRLIHALVLHGGIRLGRLFIGRNRGRSRERLIALGVVEGTGRIGRVRTDRTAQGQAREKKKAG